MGNLLLFSPFFRSLFPRHGGTRGVSGGFGFPGADDIGNMFQFKHDFEQDFCGARNIDTSRELNPALPGFAAWLSKY